MHWLYLYVAIGVEVGATTILKLSNGGERPWLLGGSLALYGVSLFLLAICLKSIPVGVAYAIWAGLGIVLVAVLGIWLFGEKMSVIRLVFFLMIVVGCVGLNLVTEAKAGAS